VLNPVTVTCVTVTTGQVGTPYSSSVSASGGTAPYTYSIASGALPDGLTLNATTGAITGTPTAFGAFNFTIKATDSTSGTALTATSNCTIIIAPAPLKFTCAANGTGEIGV